MQPSNPLISIITINRNNCTGLTRTTASLKELRDKEQIEFIFVDGQSSDESIEVAHKFYFPHEIRSEIDSGIYDAMNKGLYRAKGKYLLWLNSGDEIISKALPEIENHLKSSTASLVCFGQLSIPIEKTIAPRHWTPNPGMLPRVTVHHQSAFFLRETVIKLGGYNTNYKISGDQDLILRIYRSGHLIESNNAIVSKFYEGGASSSPQRLIEDLKLRRRHGLISPTYYLWRRLRLLNDPFFGAIKRALIGGS